VRAEGDGLPWEMQGVGTGAAIVVDEVGAERVGTGAAIALAGGLTPGKIESTPRASKSLSCRSAGAREGT
jgi:hypothetical protein